MPPRRSGDHLRIIAVVLASACLLGAADFTRPEPESLVLGKTSEQEVRQRFGDPDGRVTSRVGDKAIAILRYRYTEARSTEIPARAMTYTFHEDRLVGYDYSSSFTADRTNFDETLFKRITRGTSTRAQVLELLGKPSGEFIYPAPHASQPNQRTYVYSYSQSDRVAATKTLETGTKVMAIVFDERDVVFQTSVVNTLVNTPIR